MLDIRGIDGWKVKEKKNKSERVKIIKNSV
jgi:hypothetical protein